MFKGKKFLVTGGNGFIGSALIKGLLSCGAEVSSFDNNSRGHASKLGVHAEAVTMIEGDIRDSVAVAQAVKGADYVCHFAYINGTEYFYQKPELILDVAVRGMMNILDACVTEGVANLLLASSSEVYQNASIIPTPENVPLVVPDPLNPRYSYGGGKIISELLALNYGRSLLERVTIVRPHNVYGPDMGREHVIPQLTNRLKELCKNSFGPVDLPIQGSGQETRAFIYIDDFVDGVLRVIAQGEHQNIYNVGSEVEVSVAEIARLIGLCFGREVHIVPGPLLTGSPSRRCPDMKKLGALGFFPKTSLESGIAKTVAWYTENP